MPVRFQKSSACFGSVRNFSMFFSYSSASRPTTSSSMPPSMPSSASTVTPCACACFTASAGRAAPPRDGGWRVLHSLGGESGVLLERVMAAVDHDAREAVLDADVNELDGVAVIEVDG